VPRVVMSETLEKRSYITFKVDGVRIREYTGYSINVQISPNKAKTIAERNYLLEVLCNHFKTSLENGEYSSKSSKVKEVVSDDHLLGQLEYTINLALASKKQQNLSPKYLRNLERLANDLLQFLTAKERVMNITKLSNIRLQEFLSKYNKSATYYMTMRRHLKVLMSEAERVSKLVIPSSKNIVRQKAKPKSHTPYTASQLKNVFEYLKTHDKQLFLCTMLCYGCWLRPHNEVGKLRVNNFKDDFQKIILEADNNKSGRIRTVLVPELVRELVKKEVKGLDSNSNIFSKTDAPFNDDYFSKRWQRARKEMLKRNIIQSGHTIYSFRHTAAIDLYKRTHDVALLQRIMGHVEITTTMTYLRGLGEINEADWKISMPSFY
jgi:integrase